MAKKTRMQKRPSCRNNSSLIESLQRVVKGAIPFIDPHTDIDIPQVEPDDSDQQSPRRPLFFRCPITFGETPRGPGDVSPYSHSACCLHVSRRAKGASNFRGAPVRRSKEMKLFAASAEPMRRETRPAAKCWRSTIRPHSGRNCLAHARI